jgi:tRNA(Arg) A34 adenosine deaminase TadA
MTPTDLTHLRRCIELAREARDRGDEPFGSILVGGDGTVLAERSNQVVTDHDVTAHPELWLAAWASRHLSPADSAAATLYTSGESCAMCSGAQVWAGIGRLVFVMSGEQLGAKRGPGGPSLRLSSREVFARGHAEIVAEGPVDELVDDVLALFDPLPPR